jgi:hypothetical protein
VLEAEEWWRLRQIAADLANSQGPTYNPARDSQEEVVMSQIVVSSTVGQQFAAVTLPAEVRDEQGKLLGLFVPEPDREILAKLQPQIDDAEVQRRLAAGGGRSLAEIWKDLGVAR